MENEVKPQPTLKELMNKPATTTVEVVPPVIEELEKEPELVVVPPVVETPAEVEKKKRGPKPKDTTPVVEQETEQTLETVLTKPPVEETTGDSDLDFWNDVSKLTGEEIEVDFGGVDPISPEGALVYAKAYRDVGIETFEAGLAEKYPIEYQALVMRMEGKDPSVLYKEGSFDYTTLVIKEDDEDTQKSILKQDMKQQGLSDKRIDIMIKSIYDSGDLFTESQDSLKRLKESQEESFEQERIKIEAEKKLVNQEISSFGGVVDEIVKKGQLGDFVISDKDKAGFHKFLAENIQYVNGKFVAVVPLEKDINKLNKQLQTEYFRYKNGNLKELVVKQAITENASRLRRNIKETTKGDQGILKELDDKPTWHEQAFPHLKAKKV